MVPARYSLRSLFVRRTTTLATALGIALVVFVLSAALMLSAGVKKTMSSSGREDVGIVLRKGSDAELGSGLEDAQVSLVRAATGVAKDGEGQGKVVGEVVVVAAAEKVGADGVSNLQIRGLPADGFAFRPNAKIVAGRAAKPGTDEVMVGRSIAGRFVGTSLGDKFDIKKNRPVEVVGIFEDGGSSYESEVWADVDTVRTSFGRDGVSSARAQLTSKDAFDGFKAQIESDKRLGLMALRETEYYAKQSEGTSIFITAIGIMVSVFFSAGAMIGAMNTMYAAVANRRREIGVLRALGFSRIAILTAFVLESTALSLLGGLVGAGASLALGSVSFSMINFASWSEMVFRFEPTPDIIVTALVFAGVMGVFGGFLPAVRAARTSPAVAMRGA